MTRNRYYGWTRRLARPVAGLPLDFGDELWAPLNHHPAYEWVVAKEGESDEASIRFFLTRNLLRNVIHAAGGIEHSVEKIKAALAVAKRSSMDMAFRMNRSLSLGSGSPTSPWTTPTTSS